jgi:hypothetical protein
VQLGQPINTRIPPRPDADGDARHEDQDNDGRWSVLISASLGVSTSSR